ncbi:MAG: bifunctional 2-polyprenyl-6-hydroxyphenol methylase/3-demethylubiquinol 3-O-methyltransferase UbiG [Sphingomonadaceae bacterium]|nr:bifunctional 2-polyprenyl-6-hydroxyphenol methylase/3-demethylubiquinol 3-O-methyltransferase UbiG [Sphingomonadaceae bacterium]
MAKAIPATTINPAEAAHFGKLAADWWDPKGSSAMLHRLNPVRLRFIRAACDAHWGLNPRDVPPLAAKSAIDVGCGAGLLCEPLARLGADVVGVDAAPENIAAARQHAHGSGLKIDYRCADIADLDGAFDLVASMEVIEHVADPAHFVQALAARLAPNGLMILSTPNRTSASRLAMITLAEGLGMIPKGTHDWDKFLTPEELIPLIEAAGLKVGQISGIAFSPTKGLHLSDDLALNYILTATRA